MEEKHVRFQLVHIQKYINRLIKKKSLLKHKERNINSKLYTVYMHERLNHLMFVCVCTDFYIEMYKPVA